MDDLPLARAFDREVFGVKVVFEDEVSVVVKLGSVMINPLCVFEASELVAPVKVRAREAGARLLLTIKVEDVDAVSARLREHGVELLDGPVNGHQELTHLGHQKVTHPPTRGGGYFMGRSAPSPRSALCVWPWRRRDRRARG